jgi:hypothetical protein
MTAIGSLQFKTLTFGAMTRIRLKDGSHVYHFANVHDIFKRKIASRRRGGPSDKQRETDIANNGNWRDEAEIIMKAARWREMEKEREMEKQR